MFQIEKNVPLPPDAAGPHGGWKAHYTVFDEMLVGDSFIFAGTEQELKRFRTVIRNRNYRAKNYREKDPALFDWRWIGDKKMRVWRVS